MREIKNLAFAFRGETQFSCVKHNYFFMKHNTDVDAHILTLIDTHTTLPLRVLLRDWTNKFSKTTKSPQAPERIEPVKFWNKSRKIQATLPVHYSAL